MEPQNVVILGEPFHATTQYMTVDDIVAELPIKYERRYVAEHITKRRDFPVPLRIGARRVWKRTEFSEWVDSLQRKR